ncbi:MAG: glycogen-binding domain-containing protein [Gemmatimonadales bacterium]
MSDVLIPGEPLQRAVDALREPMALQPGLMGRTRRRRLRRAAGIGGVSTVAALVLAVALLRSESHPSGVTFTIDAPTSHSVALIGDFTDWRSDRVRLQHESSGLWEVTVHLPPGRYRFAYLVDNTEWRADSHAAPAVDDFGRPTSVITVASQ